MARHQAPKVTYHGEGVGRFPVLAGGEGSLLDDRPTKTVGSYWPYTSMLFDYIYRAKPFAQPESLSADETCALTAYVVYLNDLLEDDLVLDQNNLVSIRLPNEASFVADHRTDVFNTRCMSDCQDPAAIKIISEVLGTQQEGKEDGLVDTISQQHPGQPVYDQYCTICHKVGVGGAPIVGDPDVWRGSIGNGAEVMVDNAVNGISSDAGVMSPRGGFVPLSDDEIEQAVPYMVGESS